MMQPWQLIVNALLFQATWLSAALLSDAIAGLVLILLLASLRFSNTPRLPMVLGFGAAVLSGFSMDGVFNYAGVYHFDASRSVVPTTSLPIYLFIMWLGFAASLYVSLNWLVVKKTGFILACAVMGPLSYLAGRMLGIIEFANGDLIIMVLAWGLWASFFVWLYARLARFTHTNTGAGI